MLAYCPLSLEGSSPPPHSPAAQLWTAGGEREGVRCPGTVRGGKRVRATIQLWRNSGCRVGEWGSRSLCTPGPATEPRAQSLPRHWREDLGPSLTKERGAAGWSDTGIPDGGTESSGREPLPSTGNGVTFPGLSEKPRLLPPLPALDCVLLLLEEQGKAVSLGPVTQRSRPVPRL